MVFLTMRYRVWITLLVGGLRRLLRRVAAERTQCGCQWTPAEMPSTPHSSPTPRGAGMSPESPVAWGSSRGGAGPSPKTQASGMLSDAGVGGADQ